LSYIILEGHWGNIIVLNVHAPTDSFYEKLESVFDTFGKYHMKILLGDFNAKLWREDIFKSTIGSESLHALNNNYGHIITY
jgi:hypothetical protein